MIRKLDKEHTDQIQNLREQFAEIANLLGNLEIEERSTQKYLAGLAEQRTRLFERYDQLQTRETALLDAMRERYGDGSINIADGTFTPDTGLAD